jgi:acetyltransferase
MLETWTLSDGVKVTIRPISASDLALETEFVNGLSASTRYKRLMSSRKLSPDELKRFTDIDYAKETALIATIVDSGRERQIGVARYVKSLDNPGEAEFAIVIADEWQARGLGLQLSGHLIQAAKAEGLRQLVATTLSENEPMLAIARRLGFRVTLDSRTSSISNLTLQL